MNVSADFIDPDDLMYLEKFVALKVTDQDLEAKE